MSDDASGESRGLECPDCGCRHFEVTHTERLPEILVRRQGRELVGGGIRRRRVCRHCGRRIVTLESQVPSP